MSTTPASDDGAHSALVAWLQTPCTLGSRVTSVETIETHISLVFLVDDRVYKLKKPVKYDFLDFSTVEAREHACREEVRLNRRLAPHVYQGVRAVTQDDHGCFQLDGQGSPCDWLVEMQRLPADRMLDALHSQKLVSEADIDRLAQLLTDFYRNLPAMNLSPQSYRERCQSHVQGNCRQLLMRPQLNRAAVLRTHSFQFQLLRFQPALFDERVTAGRIIEGHGDLRPEHICFLNPIAIFDCIEFSEEFRQLDRADELAFLVSECEFIGAGWIGERLFAQYLHHSGDSVPAILFDFYKAYRACVRAKVAALRATQLKNAAESTDAEDTAAEDTAFQEAAVHLSQADRFSAPCVRPLILVVGGISGTGKTTLARQLAEQLAAELLRSDVVRQATLQCGTSASSASKYDPRARALVYEKMCGMAAELLDQKISVVLDATFSNSSAIEAAYRLSTQSSSSLSAKPLILAVECYCRPEVACARISQRLRDGTDASEASPELHDQQRLEWQTWPTQIPQIRVDTETPLPMQVDRVISEIARLWK